MATPSILRKLGDKAKQYSPFPDENEADALKEKQSTIDQLSEKPASTPAPQEHTVAPYERLHPNGVKYGENAGEKKFSESQIQDFMKPLGQLKVYDEGGDVNVKKSAEYQNSSVPPLKQSEFPSQRTQNNSGESAPKSVPPLKQAEFPSQHTQPKSAEQKPVSLPVHERMTVPFKPSSSLPPLVPDTKPTQLAPIYDEGGDVDVHDGKHQVAILQDGEKVLTPEEAQAYDQEQQGAPADFAGRVIQNPDGVKPQGSEEPAETERLSGGAKMKTDLAPTTEPQMDTSNPPTNQAETIGQEANANVPSAERLTGRKPKLDPNSPVGQVIQHDKEQAAMTGDLVGMGKAVLNEKHLATDLNAQNGAGEVSHQAKLQDYDTKIHEAMDKAAQTNDPAFQEQADRLKLAKMEYERMTPWGSAGNHPGILGKIGHVASRIGNIAGDIVAPGTMSLIPGTDLNKAVTRGQLGTALRSDTEARIAQESEQNKLKIAEAGKTNEQKTFNDLLTKINPATNQPFTKDEALQHVDADKADTKEKEADIAETMKEINPNTGQPYTRREATEAYYQMRAGTKPPNAHDAEIKDFIKSKGLQDTPENRDMARQEIMRRKTDISAKASLPYAEQKIRLQAELGEANQHLNQIGANALQRGEKADEFVQKENSRHNMRITQIDSAQNALDSSDSNMLAASIVPVLATMTESNAQGIKRLNPQELARFMPKSSGDVQQWFAANFDKLSAGQIPETYRADLRELLNNLAKEEQAQNDANLKSVDQTFKQGAVTPVVDDKGKANTTKKSNPAHTEGPPTGTTHTGKSKVDGQYYYLDANQNKLGPAPAPTK